jgi:hypothetical protein
LPFGFLASVIAKAMKSPKFFFCVLIVSLVLLLGLKDSQMSLSGKEEPSIHGASECVREHTHTHTPLKEINKTKHPHIVNVPNSCRFL